MEADIRVAYKNDGYYVWIGNKFIFVSYREENAAIIAKWMAAHWNEIFEAVREQDQTPSTP